MSPQFNCKKKTLLFQAIHLNRAVLIQQILLSISIDFVHKQLNVKTVLRQTLQINFVKVTCNPIRNDDRIAFLSKK